MKTFSVSFVALALCIATASVWAEGNSIRGVVTDVKGKPVAGAEIRAERTDGKSPGAVATSDAKGQYTLNHLAVGTYKVLASVGKAPQSAASIKTSSTGWVKVDFLLKSSFAGAQRHNSAATDRLQGQDLRRLQQDGFGTSGAPMSMGGGGH